MLFGEKMPDKNDPKYKERYERDVDAGRRFAKATRIDKAVAKVQGFANAHRTLFLVIVFGFAICGLTWNIYRLTVVYRHHPTRRTATEMQIPCSGNGIRCFPYRMYEDSIRRKVVRKGRNRTAGL